MSVGMPRFLMKENIKWIEEVTRDDGSMYFRAKKDAPEDIKAEVRKWNQIFRNARRNNIEL